MPGSKLRSRCAHCGRTVTFDARFEGRQGKCPACQSVIHLEQQLDNQAGVETKDTEASSQTVVMRRGQLDRSEQPSEPQRREPQRSEPAERMFGRYRLLRCIGRGGFGEVWEATDSHLGRRLAIKMPIFAASDTKKVQRFLAEGRTAAQLRHPNIVAVFDAGEIGGRYFLATEFVVGRPLNTYGAHRQLPVTECARLIAALARALHYAHAHQIVHRDIKPHNIVVSESDDPQILDFGLAKQLDKDAGLTIDGTVMGTPAYMAPEQARGETALIGPHSDQYSLGATLYWMLTGKPMFEGQPSVVLAQVARATPKPPSKMVEKLDPRINAICLKATSKLPSDRYTDCLEFARDLERFLEDGSVLARPTGVVTRIARWAKRNRLDAALLIATLVILCCGLSLSVYGWWDATRLARLASDAETATAQRLEEARETQAARQAELDRLSAATMRANEARRLQEAAEKQAEATQLQLREIIAQNKQLESEANDQLALVAKNTAQTEDLARQILEANAAIGNAQAKAETLAAENASFAFLHEVYRKTGEAIHENDWAEAREQLDRVLPKDRGWLWKTFNQFEIQKSNRLTPRIVSWNPLTRNDVTSLRSIEDDAVRLKTEYKGPDRTEWIQHTWLDVNTNSTLAVLSYPRAEEGSPYSQIGWYHSYNHVSDTLVSTYSSQVSKSVCKIRIQRQAGTREYSYPTSTKFYTFFSAAGDPYVLVKGRSSNGYENELRVLSFSEGEPRVVWDFQSDLLCNSFLQELQVRVANSRTKGSSFLSKLSAIAEEQNLIVMIWTHTGLESQLGIVLDTSDGTVQTVRVFEASIRDRYARLETPSDVLLGTSFNGQSYAAFWKMDLPEHKVAVSFGHLVDGFPISMQLQSDGSLVAFWGEDSAPIGTRHSSQLKLQSPIKLATVQEVQAGSEIRGTAVSPSLQQIAASVGDKVYVVDLPFSVAEGTHEPNGGISK